MGWSGGVSKGEWCHALIALVHMHALRLGLCFCSIRIRSLITAAAAIEQIHDDGRQADRQVPFSSILMEKTTHTMILIDWTWCPWRLFCSVGSAQLGERYEGRTINNLLELLPRFCHDDIDDQASWIPLSAGEEKEWTTNFNDQSQNNLIKVSICFAGWPLAAWLAVNVTVRDSFSKHNHSFKEL